MLFEKPNTNPEDHMNKEKSYHPQISNLENKPKNFRTRKIRKKNKDHSIKIPSNPTDPCNFPIQTNPYELRNQTRIKLIQ